MSHALLRGASAARLRALRPLAASRLVLARSASTTPPPPPPHTPLPMPDDMPREDYAAPAAYALGTLGTVVKYILLTTLGIGLSAVATYEGVHLYIEHVSLAAPTRAGADSEFAWEDDNLPFTGANGGTDPRLGWKGRHALRAAYLAWEMGAGDAAAIQKRAVHPDLKGIGLMGARIDRGYEVAEEYLDVAIDCARERGIVFPGGNESADPTALDLLALKAGVLERMLTPDARAQACELYERVLDALPPNSDRAARLAHKIGDLSLAAGERDEAQHWWAEGLKHAGVAVPAALSGNSVDLGKRKSESKSSGSSWWPFGGGSTPAPTTSHPAPVPVPQPTVVTPPLRRAAVNILISAAAAAAQSGELSRAEALQALALSLLPPPRWENGKLSVSVPTSSNAAATLQATWEASRVALLELHRASVSHALKTGENAQAMAAESAEHAEAVLAHLTPRLPAAYTARGSATAEPAKRLLRDTLGTAAEAQFTSALLEREAAWCKPEDRIHRLEHASEGFERAMSLAANESGTTDAKHLGESDAAGRSEEWVRFYRGYVRTREKIMKIVDEEKKV